MAQYHISGRPAPVRVFAVLDPNTPVSAAPLRAPLTTRSRVSTLAMPALEPAAAPRRRIWLPAIAGLAFVAVGAGLYLRAPAPEVVEPVAAPRAVKPARSGFFSQPKPVLTQKTWEYGRVGTAPRQTLPSPAALAAYRNEMEKLAEKQKQQLSAAADAK